MKKRFFFVGEKNSSENSDLAFTPGIEMQFLLMPCFSFQRTRLKSNFHSRFNLAAAVSRLAIIAIIKCNHCDLRNLKIQTAWRSTCVCNCIKGHFLNSFLWPVNCNWFLSLCLDRGLFVAGMPHRPQCLRLKSRRRKCVFWSQKILLCSKVRKILLCSKVLASQAGQPPSPQCVLSFPPSSQHTVEKSPQNAIIVIWNLLWNKALEEARVKLHPPGEKCFSLSDLLLSSKQTGEARKQWKTQKLKEANSNRHHLFDPWSLMVSSVTVYPAMFFHFILILLFV